LQVLAAMLHSEKNLHDLKAGMTKYPQVLINVSVSGAVDLNRPPIQEAVRAVESQLGDHGRVLLRPSGTEPVVRVMVEGPDAGQVERHARDLAGILRDTLSA
jgi:phosphoglucosamine mutase